MSARSVINHLKQCAEQRSFKLYNPNSSYSYTNPPPYDAYQHYVEWDIVFNELNADEAKKFISYVADSALTDTYIALAWDIVRCRLVEFKLVNADGNCKCGQQLDLDNAKDTIQHLVDCISSSNSKCKG